MCSCLPPLRSRTAGGPSGGLHRPASVSAAGAPLGGTPACRVLKCPSSQDLPRVFFIQMLRVHTTEFILSVGQVTIHVPRRDFDIFQFHIL